MTIRSIACPTGPHAMSCFVVGIARPELVRRLRQALLIDWSLVSPVDEGQFLEQDDRWESLSTLAFQAALDVANEALLAGDLDGGAHALMNLVGGAYFGGGDVGHAVWIAHNFDERVWRALINVCQSRRRTIEPFPRPGPRLPQGGAL